MQALSRARSLVPLLKAKPDFEVTTSGLISSLGSLENDPLKLRGLPAALCNWTPSIHPNQYV